MATQALVAARPASELSPAEQRAAYDDNGYLVFPTLLDAGELASLRSALAAVLREAEGLTDTNDKFSITRTDDGGYSVRRIFDPIAQHAAFHDLVLQSQDPRRGGEFDRSRTFSSTTPS